MKDVIDNNRYEKLVYQQQGNIMNSIRCLTRTINGLACGFR